jgi:AcrR family transcriptional regulator
MSETRERWLDEGLQILSEEGAAGVRIDRIAARLGLSKGSFHHHFRGATGYKLDLLAHFERRRIGAIESAIAEAGTSADAHTVLAGLTTLVRPGETGLYHPNLDVAMRAWSTWDPEVREAQARIDAAVIAALQTVWGRAVAADDDARIAAMLPYLLAVGASVVVPAVSPAELRRMYELLLPLVPSEAEQA